VDRKNCLLDSNAIIIIVVRSCPPTCTCAIGIIALRYTIKYVNYRPSIIDTILSFVFIACVYNTVGVRRVEFVRRDFPGSFRSLGQVRVPGMKTVTQMKITFIPRSRCFVCYYYYSEPLSPGSCSLIECSIDIRSTPYYNPGRSTNDN